MGQLAASSLPARPRSGLDHSQSRRPRPGGSARSSCRLRPEPQHVRQPGNSRPPAGCEHDVADLPPAAVACARDQGHDAGGIDTGGRGLAPPSCPFWHRGCRRSKTAQPPPTRARAAVRPRSVHRSGQRFPTGRGVSYSPYIVSSTRPAGCSFRSHWFRIETLHRRSLLDFGQGAQHDD